MYDFPWLRVLLKPSTNIGMTCCTIPSLGNDINSMKASAAMKSKTKVLASKNTKAGKVPAKSKPLESRKPGKNSAALKVTVPPLPEGCMPNCSAVERVILAALASLQRMGANSHPRALVSNMCGYKNARSATYLEATKNLRSMGLVDFPTGDAICLTSAGVSSCGTAAARPTTNKEMHDLIKSVLPSPKGADIFRALLDRRPHERTTLAEVVGYSNPRVRRRFSSTCCLRLHSPCTN
jgi:hypothetical protein